MLVVVADTHSREGSRLRGRTLAAVREADLTIHAGDFYREPVLDAFESTARRLSAVFGNNADAAVRDRLPAVRTVDHGGFGSRSHTATATATRGWRCSVATATPTASSAVTATALDSITWGMSRY